MPIVRRLPYGHFEVDFLAKDLYPLYRRKGGHTSWYDLRLRLTSTEVAPAFQFAPSNGYAPYFNPGDWEEVRKGDLEKLRALALRLVLESRAFFKANRSKRIRTVPWEHALFLLKGAEFDDNTVQLDELQGVA